MCANYRPLRPERLAALRRGPAGFGFEAECYPGRTAPFLGNCEETIWLEGIFGLLPHWAKPTLARSTYNARSESVAAKPSFSNAWQRRQLAIIPAECFYEPNYESGRAVRWRIERKDGNAFGIAGLWERRQLAAGGTEWSFTMLTINADSHPLMSRFHAPGKEKRSVVVLPETLWQEWLSSSNEREMRSLLQPFDASSMVAHPDQRLG